MYYRTRPVRKIGVPKMATVLTCICVIVYIALAVLSRNPITISSYWLALAGQFNYMVLKEGWWWQTFTALFVHVSLLHLAFNAFYLYTIGSSFESNYGVRFFLLTFFASGIAGNLITLALGPNIISAGASGAIFGLIGAMTMITRARYGGHMKEALSSLIILLLINSIWQGVNILAHAGGLATGVILGLAYNRFKRPRYGSYPYMVRYYRW